MHVFIFTYNYYSPGFNLFIFRDENNPNRKFSSIPMSFLNNKELFVSIFIFIHYILCIQYLYTYSNIITIHFYYSQILIKMHVLIIIHLHASIIHVVLI